jgi:nucleoside-diphosphate-sugar epimerase
MDVFVSGGSGFLGGRLIERLIARGDRVRALARSDAAAEAVRRLGAEPVRGDLDQPSALTEAMRGTELVFHAAAATQEWAPLEHFRRINVEGTRNVLSAARAAKVRRLVHVSTESVLLDGKPLVDVDESRPIPSRVIGRYPRTKAEAEGLVRAANGDGLETIVVRPRLVWGKGDTTVLPKLVEAVSAGRFAWIDQGRALTSTCHVRNACEGLVRAAERGRPGEVYFVTDGEPVEVRGFLTAMLATQGVDPGARSVPRGVAYAAATLAEGLWTLVGRASPPPAQRTAILLIGQQVTVRDDKARRELGYSPVITREAGLQELAGSAR